MPREWQFQKKVVQFIWNTNVRADVNLFAKSLPNVVHGQGRDRGFVPGCVDAGLVKLADVCLPIIATVMDDAAGHLLLIATFWPNRPHCSCYWCVLHTHYRLRAISVGCLQSIRRMLVSVCAPCTRWLYAGKQNIFFPQCCETVGVNSIPCTINNVFKFLQSWLEGSIFVDVYGSTGRQGTNWRFKNEG